MDRNISVSGLISLGDCEYPIKKSHLAKSLEEILLQPRYASFISSSLSISDDYERGLITDLGPFRLWCRELAGEIAGEEIDGMMNLIALDNVPIVVKMSLNALLNGLYYRKK
jgi:iron complex transport system substrate-binding protein